MKNTILFQNFTTGGMVVQKVSPERGGGGGGGVFVEPPPPPPPTLPRSEPVFLVLILFEACDKVASDF